MVELRNIPRNKRAEYREAVGKSYQLLNSATNLIILRLGDILLLEKPSAFISEMRKLDNIEEWMTLEREVRLCSNLREVHPSMDGLLTGLGSPRFNIERQGPRSSARGIPRSGSGRDF